MRTINRLTCSLTILITIAVFAFTGYCIWLFYVRIPNFREDIREQTANAVTRWFPIGEEGGFTYDVEVDQLNDICFIKNLNVDKGEGGILNGIEFASYQVTIDSIKIFLRSLIDDQPLKVMGLQGVEIKGDIEAEVIRNHFNPKDSGITAIAMDYDDFTEKTTITADIAEITGMEISITGKWKIEDGKLILADRKYHNPDGPASIEVIEFIEEHTDISISFSMLGYPLDVTGFKFDGAIMSVELERV